MYVNGKQVGNDINSIRNAYRNVAREVNKLDRNSEEYRAGVKKMRGLKGELARHQQALKGVQTRWQKLGAAARKYSPIAVGAVIGTAIVSAFRNGMQTITEFQDANAKLNAVLGVTKEETKELRDQQIKLGSSTAFTAGQAAEAQTELAKLGFTMREITNLTPAVLDLAAAAGTDLPNAASIAGSTLRQFGLDSSETQRVVDVMAKSFSSSALDIEKFKVAMGSAGPVAAAAGVSLEKTTSLLGLLADRGLDASTAGTSLRNIFLQTAKAGLTFEEAMLMVKNATDQNVQALDLFGTRGATAAVIMANNAEAAGKLETALENAGGAAQEMAEKQLDTLTGDVTKLGSAWEGFVLSLENGEGVLAKLSRGFVQATTDAIGFINEISKRPSDTFAILFEALIPANAEKSIYSRAALIALDKLKNKIGSLVDESNVQGISEYIGELERMQGQVVNGGIAFSKLGEEITKAKAAQSTLANDLIGGGVGVFDIDPNVDPDVDPAAAAAAEAAAKIAADAAQDALDIEAKKYADLLALIMAEEEKIAMAKLEGLDQELAKIDAHYADLLAKAAGHADETLQIEKMRDDARKLATEEYEIGRAEKAAEVQEQIVQALLTADELEIQKLTSHYDELIALAELHGIDATAVEAAKQDALTALTEDGEAQRKGAMLEAFNITANSANDLLGVLVSNKRAQMHVGRDLTDAQISENKKLADDEARLSNFMVKMAAVQNAVNASVALSGAIKQAQWVPFPANIVAMAAGVAAVMTLIGSAKTLLSSAPSTPAYATGTRSAVGGMSLVGEQGPEMINLPAGSQVMPAGPTRNLLFGPNAQPDFGSVPDLSGRSGGSSGKGMEMMLGKYMAKMDSWASTLTVQQRQTDLDDYNQRYNANLKRVKSVKS